MGDKGKATALPPCPVLTAHDLYVLTGLGAEISPCTNRPMCKPPHAQSTTCRSAMELMRHATTPPADRPMLKSLHAKNLLRAQTTTCRSALELMRRATTPPADRPIRMTVEEERKLPVQKRVYKWVHGRMEVHGGAWDHGHMGCMGKHANWLCCPVIMVQISIASQLPCSGLRLGCNYTLQLVGCSRAQVASGLLSTFLLLPAGCMPPHAVKCSIHPLLNEPYLSLYVQVFWSQRSSPKPLFTGYFKLQSNWLLRAGASSYGACWWTWRSP